MNNYDRIAPFYDIEHTQFDADLEMYRNFAQLRSGPLLELACGSGRLLLPLARTGHTLTGVDSSASMLKLAQTALEHAGLAQRCTLVQQDMRTMQLGQTFSLAFVALGSFAHLTSRSQQQQALTAIRAHLTSGGLFILDISNTDVRYMEHLSGHILHQGSWLQEDDTMLTHFVSPASSPTQHLLELTHFYDVHPQAGPVQRTIITTHLYLFERAEMELLLEGAGFALKEVYGDYDLGSYEHESPRMIFLAEAK